MEERAQDLPGPDVLQDNTQSVLDASREELKKWQSEDPMLARARELAQQNSGEHDRVTFFYQDGVLYRQCGAPKERRRMTFGGVSN